VCRCTTLTCMCTLHLTLQAQVSLAAVTWPRVTGLAAPICKQKQARGTHARLAAVMYTDISASCSSLSSACMLRFVATAGIAVSTLTVINCRAKFQCCYAFMLPADNVLLMSDTFAGSAPKADLMLPMHTHMGGPCC